MTTCISAGVASVASAAILLTVSGAFADPSAKAADEPGQGATVPVTMVETLKPTFAWSGSKEPGVLYDFIICLGVQESHGFWVPGKTAYFRQGLNKTSLTIDKPLASNTVYVWSVRIRLGKRISAWAALSDSDPKRFEWGGHRHNILCPFKTPPL